MQPALPSPMPDATLAVFAVNSGKPHQGATGKNPGLHRAFFAVNSTTALGVSWGQWSATVPGARVTYEYDAFGNSFTVSGTTPNNYLYRGEQYDSDLGLYYLRARYYNPATGRFMSRDPEDADVGDPVTLHKYLYTGSDPVNLIDPSGRNTLVLNNPWQLAGAGDLGEYALITAFMTFTAVAVLPPIACDINALLSMGALGVRGYFEIAADFPACTATGTPPKAPPIAPPLPLPLPVPQPAPQPPQKSPRCKDLNAIVDGIKATIGSSGGSCSVSLSPAENFARLALWNAYLNARLDERAECSQYDPNPAGHKQQIDQIWTNIINCEVILHEF